MSATTDLMDERITIEDTLDQSLTKVKIGDEDYFKIGNVDTLRPFFMSIVSSSNHWMFISSNGGLTAGRKNAQFALFPYYTDDKITESADITGSKTILRVKQGDSTSLWEPFSNRNGGNYATTRNLYKNRLGNKILFEEVNHDLHLTFRYQWASSNLYGFVREASLVNTADTPVTVEILDGIQNMMPYGVASDTQNKASNLVDAYKRSELVPEAGLGIYALSAIIVDKAEPSEALKANVAWSLGMENATHLMSSLQLDAFRKGHALAQETDVKGEKGAYFLNSTLVLDPEAKKEWIIVANVNQDHAGIIDLCEAIKNKTELKTSVLGNVEKGSQKLIAINAASDGLQCTADDLRDARHFSNTLFNIMRGGIFDDHYQIEKWDFEKYLQTANKAMYHRQKEVLKSLPDEFTAQDIMELAQNTSDRDFERLCIEYLPLKFSRRHGDPSRPWNIFSINTHSEIDGSKILDYEGNWRDIFQNWEALAYAYPAFIEGMILKFFNASTFDGYNPYRVTKDGFDWEVIEPDDPWSYIGYWGDHQIIYSLKFLEFIQKHYPEKLEAYFTKDVFVYANVPYTIKPFEALLQNPKDTIDFNLKVDEQIRRERPEFGGDAALLKQQGGELHRVNFIEKMLASVLAKVSNFIPGAGIWLNTQRPEWNDANNALVGNGVSMVTLYYLRRYLKFFDGLLADSEEMDVPLSSELLEFFRSVHQTLEQHASLANDTLSDAQRRQFLDGLGIPASRYRERIYQSSFSGKREALTLNELKGFITTTLAFLEQTIRTNKRADGLYHAYNLMTVEGDGCISISHLNEMLEGQVAVLSAGALNGKEALEVLDALKASAMFRPDQYSYMLYPNKELPKFMDKNTIPTAAAESSELLVGLIKDGNTQVAGKDAKGVYHFNGNFKNANDLVATLDRLAESGIAVPQEERQKLLALFEEVFDHKSFTGRSGTFFGYEGLGSIYWHMVSKLLLAVQECCIQAIEAGETPETIGRLLEHYYEINAGIGVHKSPKLYGAFPTDPYSHTPAGKGAQQPGMTGQVKEDILSRFGDLGVVIRQGQLHFAPTLLRKQEFLSQAKTFSYVALDGTTKQLELPEQSLAFTYCQVPVRYLLNDTEGITLHYSDGSQTQIPGLVLDVERSSKLFSRSGEISFLSVQLSKNRLR